MSFLVVYFACHFSKNWFVYNATCTMFIVQLFIKCSSFIGGIKDSKVVLCTYCWLWNEIALSYTGLM